MEELIYDFSTLPPHILTNILLYTHKLDFKNSVLTCRSWYYASCHPKITRTRRSVMTTGSNSIAVDQLTRPITHLLLEHPNLNKLQYRQLFTKFGKTINHLQIRCNKLQTPKLYEILIHLPRLESLEIFDGANAFSALNFRKCGKLRKHHERIRKNLENLNFLAIRNSLINLDGYKLLLNLSRNLKRFEWNEYGSDASGQRDFLYNFLLNPMEMPSLLNLEELLIQSIHPCDSSEFFAKMVAIKLPHLKKLNILEISSSYYDLNFNQFCKVYQHLEEFDMGNCNADQLNDICEYMTNLKCLSFIECYGIRLTRLRKLKQLESIKIDRFDDVDYDDDEEFFNTVKWEQFRTLKLNKISEKLFKLICQHMKNLVDLRLEAVETKNCEPIFRNLTKLEKLHLEFEEPPESHSSRIISSHEWNVTRLVRLKEIHVSCYVPGITPSLLRTLPNLNLEDINRIYDPTDEQRFEYETKMKEYFNASQNYSEPIQMATDDIEEVGVIDFDWYLEKVYAADE